jgi:methyl-accepting chemotaxis protein
MLEVKLYRYTEEEKMKQFKTIRTRTLISILPSTIILLCVLSFSSYFISKNIINQEINNKMEYKVNELSSNIESKLIAHSRIAETLARTVEASGNSMTKDQYKAIVQSFPSINPDTLGTGVWFEPNKYKNDIKYFGPYAYKDNGKIVYTEEYATDSYNYPSQDWYKLAKTTNQNVVWSSPYVDDVTKITMVTTAAPFYDKDKNFLGTTTADINLTSLQDIVNKLSFGKTGNAFLVTEDGTYIAGTKADQIMKMKITDDPRFFSIGSNIIKNHNGNAVYKDGKDSRVVYYKQIPDTKWIMGITVSNSELLGQLNKLMLALIAISLILIVLISIAIINYSNYITKNIAKVNYLSSIVSAGDLTHSVEIKSSDELGQMANNLNTMASKLRSTFKSISNSIDNIVGTSEELTASAEQTQNAAEQVAEIMQEMSAGADSNAKNTEEISTVVSKINADIGEITEKVNSTTSLSLETSKLAKNSNAVISKLIDHMANISNKVSQSTDIVNVLGTKSTQIDSIITLINSISQQTNLLALNAAIEAARAGEQGKGFAVVAEEVRKLAEQSRTASGEISKLITEIQKEIKEGISAMTAGNAAVAEGETMVSTVGTSFKNIVDSFNTVSEQMKSVSLTIQDLYDNSHNMVSSIQSISNVSKESADNIQNVAAGSEEQTAIMKQVADSAQNLTKNVTELQTSISNFKL